MPLVMIPFIAVIAIVILWFLLARTFSKVGGLVIDKILKPFRQLDETTTEKKEEEKQDVQK